MAIHVAILMRPYLQMILDGRKTIESRLTRQPIVPFRRIQPGERIFFKASAGPFMATAVAGTVEFFEDLTPGKVQALRQRFNQRVCGDAAFWQWKRSSRYATFIELRDVQTTNVGPALAPSPGPAWFVLSDQMAPAQFRANMNYSADKCFDVPLSAGGLRNNYVRLSRGARGFPADANAGQSGRQNGTPVTLQLPDGQAVETDILASGMIRWRGWGEYFAKAALTAGDFVRFVERGQRQYSVEFVGRNPAPAVNVPAGTTSPPSGPPRLGDFVSAARLKTLIHEARDEDLGPSHRDVTGEMFIRASQRGRFVLRSRADGRLSGAALFTAITAAYDRRIRVQSVLSDGAELKPGSAIAHFVGPVRAILAMERVALNFATHLSGIASLTARYVAAVAQAPGDSGAGNRARICETRKTIPGLRGLEKYAVVCGGGVSHRMGLYDAVLVKDNHIAHLKLAELGPVLSRAIVRARAAKPKPAFVEVEVDTLAQLQRILTLSTGARPDMVLLDNMAPAQLRQAVELRDRLAREVLLEASGGVNLDSVAAIATTGIDRISVGALTHSAPALDLGLDEE